MRKTYTFMIGLLFSALVWSAAPALAQFGQMQGTVKDEDGKPFANGEIHIDREDIKAHYEVKTDKNGKFFYAALPLGRYSVSIKMKDGKIFKALSGIATSMREAANVEIDLQQFRMQAEAQAAGVQVAPTQPGGKLSQEQMEAIAKASKEREEQIKKRQELVGNFDAGVAALAAKDYDTAIKEFQEAATVDPTQHVLFAQMGEAYSAKAAATRDKAEKQQMYDKSIESYQQAITLKADDASYHNNFALALANAGKIEEAQAELVKAAELDPTNAGRYYFNAGAVLVNTGNTKVAAEAFRKATEVSPTMADAYYQLGVTLTGMAEVDPKTGSIIPVAGTKEALEKYVQLAPDGPNADSAKSLLDTMSGTVTTQVGGKEPPKQQPRR